MKLRTLRRAGSRLANIQKKIQSRETFKGSQAQGGVHWLRDSRWPELDSCCCLAACIGGYRGARKGAGYRGQGWDVKPRGELEMLVHLQGVEVKCGDHSRAGRNCQ